MIITDDLKYKYSRMLRHSRCEIQRV